MNKQTTELDRILALKEDEHLEFKEGKNRIDFDEVVKYCTALANEGGGQFVIGVSNKIPHEVVGTTVFPNLERTKANLIERLHLRIDIEETNHPHGRVVILSVPSRPLGVPISYNGAFWMRAGEDLAPMTTDLIKRILEESGPDYSAEVCPDASMSDLDPVAIEIFRKRWMQKSQRSDLANLSIEQLFEDAELLCRGKLTYAALILFGTRKALGRFLAQSETIFEYRSNEVPGPAQQRIEYRQGFFSFYDEIWDKIQLRNDKQHYQDGLFLLELSSFHERVIREAILNAVSHRDYRLGGSIFVRQFPDRLEIVSPGGLPHGITIENILWKQNPRNRRIAEVFSKCGLVERSGQGLNLIYGQLIREGKPQPDFTHTDKYQVSLTFYGQIQDPKFLQFLEKVGQEKLQSFQTEDFLIVDAVFHNRSIQAPLKSRASSLIQAGILETIGRGKGSKLILSQRFHAFIGSKGTYTRQKGLDRETNKALLLKHIQDNQSEGAQLQELTQVLPNLSRDQVQKLLKELRTDGKISLIGANRGGRWIPAE